MLVYEDRNVVAAHRVYDEQRTYAYIMVSQDAVTKRAAKGVQEFSAAVDRMVDRDKGERAEGDEVSSDQDEIGSEAVDPLHDPIKEVRLGELIQVDIADLNDPVTMKSVRQVANRDWPFDHVDLVPCDLTRIERETGGRRPSGKKEVAPGDP